MSPHKLVVMLFCVLRMHVYSWTKTCLERTRWVLFSFCIRCDATFDDEWMIHGYSEGGEGQTSRLLDDDALTTTAVDAVDNGARTNELFL
jgi:hypothetical protein